jgi:hypothetical protein
VSPTACRMVRRCVGPEQVTHIPLAPSVDSTEAHNRGPPGAIISPSPGPIHLPGNRPMPDFGLPAPSVSDADPNQSASGSPARYRGASVSTSETRRLQVAFGMPSAIASKVIRSRSRRLRRERVPRMCSRAEGDSRSAWFSQWILILHRTGWMRLPRLLQPRK